MVLEISVGVLTVLAGILASFVCGTIFGRSLLGRVEARLTASLSELHRKIDAVHAHVVHPTIIPVTGHSAPAPKA